MQNVNNHGNVDQQINTTGNVVVEKKPTRWASRFAKLKEEVEGDIRFDKFIDDFKTYNTLLDGKSMPEKLRDGGFSELEILKATIKKDKYARKIELKKMYQTEQIIDVELFASISFNFETYVLPLIESEAKKNLIKIELNEKVISPILSLLNVEGEDDNYLNYTVDDILGMVYFLTGKCHLNWANYDNL